MLGTVLTAKKFYWFWLCTVPSQHKI